MIIRNNADREAFFSKARMIDLTRKPWIFTAELYKPDRSNAQNRLSFMWYAELGKHSGSGKDFERNYCKFHYACPILVEVDDEFSKFYTKLVERYDYEECCAAMEFLQVTSRKKFKMPLFAEYLNHIKLYGAEIGCQLTQPIDIFDLAMRETA